MKLDGKNIPANYNSCKTELADIKAKHFENAKEIFALKEILRNRGVEWESENNNRSDEGSNVGSERSSSYDEPKPSKRIKLSDDHAKPRKRDRFEDDDNASSKGVILESEDTKNFFLLFISREYVFPFSPFLRIFFSVVSIGVLYLIKYFDCNIDLLSTTSFLSIFFAIKTFMLMYKQYNNCVKLFNSYLKEDYLHSPIKF